MRCGIVSRRVCLGDGEGSSIETDLAWVAAEDAGDKGAERFDFFEGREGSGHVEECEEGAPLGLLECNTL